MRKILFSGSLAAFLLMSLLVQARAQRGESNGNGGESEVQRGFAIAPVTLNLVGKNPSLVGLGSYLVNGPGDCIGCHTGGGLFLMGGDPFQGQTAIVNTANYLAGGAAFGPFISRNLTPDRNGRPAGLTLEQFKLVLRTGVDLKAIPPGVPNSPGLLQVMPWPQFRHSTDRDLEAIYEYLRSIPCKEGGPGLPPNRC
jgi:mono/diheme cytochrome c family protein